MPGSIASLYPDWSQYNSRIRDAVVHLNAEQLALRAGAGHAPIWALAAHTAGTRTYWLCGVFGQPGAEKTPFTEPLSGWGWEDDEDHPRSGQELAWALDSTFEVLRDCLDRWTLDDLPLTATRTYAGVTTVHTRASVLNRMFSHDAFHAGEISQLLGVHDLEAIDLWRRASAVTVP